MIWHNGQPASKLGLMSDPTPRLRDAFPYNDSFNAMEVATADRRFEQLIERRERLIERSRFGILALNGASVIGVLSSYESLRALAGTEPRFALAFFVAGMVFALLSIHFETNFVGSRAAHMFGHLSRLRRIRSTLDDRLTNETADRLDEQLREIEVRSSRQSLAIKLDETKDGLPNDFAFSPLAMLSFNFAGGAWIGGVGLLLGALFT